MRTSRFVVGIALVLCVAGQQGCRGERKDPQQTGVSKGKIKFGQWGPQSGPAAPWGIVARGTAAYFDMINAEGGVNGNKLELVLEDDQYNPAQTVRVVKKMVERDQVFALIGGVGTATGRAAERYIMKNMVPWVGPASGSARWADPFKKNVFSLYPRYDIEAALLVTHLVEKEKKEKIAFIYQNDDYGKEGLQGAEAQLGKLGKSIAVSVSVNFGETNLVSHVSKLKASEADAVILWLSPEAAIRTIGTAMKLGFTPQWATSSTCSDATLLFMKSKGLWDNVIFPLFLEPPDSDHPLVKKYKVAFDKHGKVRNSRDMFGVFFLAGFYFAEPAVEALTRCGKDVTRKCFIAKLESLKDWNGGLGHKITFGPKQRQGARWWFIARAVKGKTVKLTDWITLK